jgi:phosphatidylglycerol:prolipoprotein diacylglycerol transferase
MFPILFEIGPIKIGGYGVMLALSFLTAAYIMRKEFQRKGFQPDWANTVVVLAAVTGIVGSRVYFIFEHFDDFLNDPLGLIFSGSGLTYYGGFIAAFVAVVILIRRLPAPTLQIGDIIAPLLLLGYGIGRIGCFLAGDGDYGPPSDLPWAMAFPNGLIPTNIPVHPTPLYETIISISFFLILWNLRKRHLPDGSMISGMLIFYGIERFITEFWRLNSKILWGLSMAQLISLVSIAGGIVFGIYLFQRNKNDISVGSKKPAKSAKK